MNAGPIGTGLWLAALLGGAIVGCGANAGDSETDGTDMAGATTGGSPGVGGGDAMTPPSGGGMAAGTDPRDGSTTPTSGGGTQDASAAPEGSVGRADSGSTGASDAMAGGTPSGGMGTRDGGADAGSPGTPGGDGGTGAGACTASKPASRTASGSGPHKVVVETNADPGINEGTIFRPADLGGAEKYPIYVWGEGGCSRNGLSNAVALGEIASHGYFVVADGTPNGTGSRSMGSTVAMGKPLLAYIDWAIAENEKPCSAYYHSLDTTKIASNGFSCGGLMAMGTSGDPRLTTWGQNSSGLFSADQALYKKMHTPGLIVLGGADDIAYQNGLRDYAGIAPLGLPIMLFSKALGHGGDLFKASGDFVKIDLAWLNWWLKGDQTATGKGRLVGAGCTYCSDAAWEVKSMNIP